MSIGAGERWEFEAVFNVGAASATGTKMGFTISNAEQQVLVTFVGASPGEVLVADGMSAATYGTGTSTLGVCRAKGQVLGNASGAGTLQFQMQPSSTKSTCTIYAGSFIIAHKIV